MKTLVFLPTYNERDNIILLIDKILDIKVEPRVKIDILVIDDNSPDGTAEAIENILSSHKNIHLIVRPRKLGLGTALKKAIEFAYENEYETMVLMDADFQHPPELIPILIGEVVNGNDLVIASRYVPGGGVEKWGLIRRIISKGANYYVRIMLGIPINDSTSGFRAFSRRALAYLSSEEFLSKGYALQVEIAYKLWKKGFMVKEIPFIFGVRRSGSSKLGLGVMFEFFLNVYRLKY